jgi:hypothetical protein
MSILDTHQEVIDNNMEDPSVKRIGDFASPVEGEVLVAKLSQDCPLLVFMDDDIVSTVVNGPGNFEGLNAGFGYIFEQINSMKDALPNNIQMYVNPNQSNPISETIKTYTKSLPDFEIIIHTLPADIEGRVDYLISTEGITACLVGETTSALEIQIASEG